MAEQQGLFDQTATNEDSKEERSTQVTETLAPYRPTVPSTEVGGFGIEGLEGMGKRDIILPRKTIVQLTSKKSDLYGGFYDNLTQQAVKTIDAVILSITHTRALWSGDPADEKPECTSVDGITGREHGLCAECQFNPDNDPNLWGKGMKRCSLGYLLLCVDTTDDSMFVFSALKTSAKSVKPLISQFVNKRRPPFTFVTRFENVKVIEDNNTYYVFKPSIVKQLEPAETARYREMYLAMKGVEIKDIEESDENGEPEGEAPF